MRCHFVERRDQVLGRARRSGLLLAALAVRVLPGVALLAVTVLPGVALAHDDPIVTVRVLCNGFNVLDIDAVLGEISTTATLSVERPVRGSAEIEAWVREQMDHDLRIEIVDIGTPQRLTDGYALTWTARFSREDWRRAGVQNREVTSAISIHNGRITDWQASLAANTPAVPESSANAPSAVQLSANPPSAAQQSSANAPSAAPIAVREPAASSGVPALFGVPVTLLLAVFVVGLAGLWLTRRLVRQK